MRTAYECRACPAPEQAAQLGRTFEGEHLVRNEVLAARHRAYHAEGRRISREHTDVALTSWRTGEPALPSEVSSLPPHQTLRHPHAAFADFFAGRARYPRFRSRNGRQSARSTRSAFRMPDGQLLLARSGTPLRSVRSWDDEAPVALRPRVVLVSDEMGGRWFVTVAVDTDDPEPALEIGHAVGVGDLAAASDGEKIAHPRRPAPRARSLARHQRMMARRRKGSTNRREAGTKVVRAHVEVRHARSDFAHRTSTRLVRGADVIAVENLAVENMVRNRRLVRVLPQTSWAGFRRHLEHEVERAGKTLVVVDRRHPSSKTCSACGQLRGELELSVQHWSCPSRRTRHDRDINAVEDILSAGPAVAACGADARRGELARAQSTTKQETRPVRGGFPRL